MTNRPVPARTRAAMITQRCFGIPLALGCCEGNGMSAAVGSFPETSKVDNGLGRETGD